MACIRLSPSVISNISNDVVLRIHCHIPENLYGERQQSCGERVFKGIKSEHLNDIDVHDKMCTYDRVCNRVYIHNRVYDRDTIEYIIDVIVCTCTKAGQGGSSHLIFPFCDP